ncbi:divalent metal cation transporter [bacterium]|nr:MAG: divalent metal cation transporter [bacterium]
MANLSRLGFVKPGSDTSLPEVNRSLPVVLTGSWWKRFLSFAGPGYLVAVGYMDPGNWATDLAGGSKFGYTLLWVILASNLMAMVLQAMCARLGIATGRDLAQACRDFYSRPVSVTLWILCEIAIVACDVAEVIGSAVAINLLFPRISLVTGVFITGADVLLLLGLMKFGFRKIEAIILVMVGTIFACFAINVFAARPELGPLFKGLVTPSIPNAEALWIAVGILGATVMPHNLYLHSSLVQTRKTPEDTVGKRQSIKLASLDAIVALGGAFFVNAAILILAAAVFKPKGHVVEGLGEAHDLLIPLLGGSAATLFAVALLMAGQASTITATLAGQIVMEGFMKWKIEPWVRRLATRSLAIVPAAFLVAGAGGDKTVHLLTITQVVLSMQLPFAIFPLVGFTSSKKRMGDHVNPMWMVVVGWLICLVITGLNITLLWNLFFASK